MLRVLLVAALLVACADDDPRLLSPASTFAAYRSALGAGDAQASWSCLSQGHQQHIGDLAAWERQLASQGRQLQRQVARLEIAEETIINDELAFLRFDASTVADGVSPFYYYLREADGWKITTHVDSLFRARLEVALERGEYRLPSR